MIRSRFNSSAVVSNAGDAGGFALVPGIPWFVDVGMGGAAEAVGMPDIRLELDAL